MKKLIVSLALIAVLAAMLLPALASGGTMYVYTDNGKTLNVRSSPHTGNNGIGALKYGAEVTVLELRTDGWAEILWEQNDYGEFSTAYVQSRFLVNYKPAPHSSKPASGGSSGSGSAGGADYARIFTTMNAEFASGRKVSSPYTVVARPSRASGWVNLRWAPATEAERIATCKQGKELTVLAELRNWYQVEDPETGMIGFISREFTSFR